MEFVGYEKCDKLICTSSESRKNKNITRKQGIPKINMNMIFPSSTLGFGCSPYKNTCDIFLENLVSHRLQAYLSKNEGDVLSYTNKV